MKWSLRLTLVAAGVLAACSESPTSTDLASSDALQPSFSQEFASPGNHVHVMPTQAKYLEAFAKGGGKPGGSGGGNTGIFYHGGPVIYTPRVAAIYWSNSTIFTGGPTPGATGAGSQDHSLVGDFMNGLGASAYWQVNTTYTDGGSGRVGGSLDYTAYWAANTNVPAPGSSVSDAQIQAQIIAAFNGNKFTYDASTVYAVFTGPGVNLGGGFGSQYCAYHGHFSWNGKDVKFAAMPYNYDFKSGCTAGQAPNGDPAADAEVNTLAHEIEEFATDPDLNAWYDRRGYENADKCAWNFGTTTGGNGAKSNITVGGKRFLVQQNWINSGSGGCVLHT